MPGENSTPTIPNSGYIPTPAGTTENGEPFWIIDDRKISWAEMQQLVWQQQAAQQARGGGRGPEGLANMPVMPTMPDFSTEAKLETGSERGPETNMESKAERAAEQESGVEQQTSQPAQPNPPTAQKTQAPSLLGDSPKLTSVDPGDPASMHSFYKQHNEGKGDPQKSTTFLATLFGKILRSLFAGEGK